MSFPVVSGASVMCTMGMSPGQLIATSQTSILMGGKPVATIQDVAPNTNVTPCGMCTSMANPAVAAATAAALGVLHACAVHARSDGDVDLSKGNPGRRSSRPLSGRQAYVFLWRLHQYCDAGPAKGSS